MTTVPTVEPFTRLTVFAPPVVLIAAVSTRSTLDFEAVVMLTLVVWPNRTEAGG